MLSLCARTIRTRTATPQLVMRCQIHTTNNNYANSKLAEVGKLEPVKLTGNYDTGQMFLHRLFGYRGIILFPWMARVYDRDLGVKDGRAIPFRRGVAETDGEKDEKTKKKEPDPDEEVEQSYNIPGKNKEIKGKTHTYYQVLMDNRDCQHITNRAQWESVTFLGSNSENARNLYAIPGLDYVAHEDILPYSCNDRTPVHHELFDKFFVPKEGDNEVQFQAQNTLTAWQDKNHPWLELSDVHKETTEDIRVTVIPFYMGYRENQLNNVYWWRYCIRLENLGDKSVQLRERNWRIFSLSGTLETVRGRGVVGQEPILCRSQPAFQYSSHVSLQAPSGHMWGTFRMERQDGYSFDCRIPPFSLESKIDDSNGPSLGM